MRVIELTHEVGAPPTRCFDLARSIEAHLNSTSRTGERVVGGVATGLLTLGDEVTWEARHFGIRQRFTSQITAFDRPRLFRDVMTKGAFRRFAHDHVFEPTASGTLIRDAVSFEAPFGPVGRLAEALVLDGYLRGFLSRRNAHLRQLAESEGWRQFLPATADSAEVMRAL